MKSFKQVLNESSLSRLWKHNIEHDCAAFTAFRKGEDCGTGREYTKKENKQRNKSLKAKLLSAGYGVTAISGVYPEGGVTQKEESFFVVNLKDDANFFAKIAKLGEKFEQDSVLLVPKGAIDNSGEKAYLIGTNHCPNNWLGFGKKEVFNRGRLGYDSPIYTSKVNGRPFIFESVGDEFSLPASGQGNWVLNRIAEAEWNTIDVS